jgi:hypothetical protein
VRIAVPEDGPEGKVDEERFVRSEALAQGDLYRDAHRWFLLRAGQVIRSYKIIVACCQLSLGRNESLSIRPNVPPISEIPTVRAIHVPPESWIFQLAVLKLIA